ncbi:hypothetical protein HDU93_007838 [Gonapodya sp. JEL0774]|nr:hypothetical protein HDU93_007838 [Gonapodya sp. JEL0774]
MQIPSSSGLFDELVDTSLFSPDITQTPARRPFILSSPLPPFRSMVPSVDDNLGSDLLADTSFHIELSYERTEINPLSILASVATSHSSPPRDSPHPSSIHSGHDFLEADLSESDDVLIGSPAIGARSCESSPMGKTSGMTATSQLVPGPAGDKRMATRALAPMKGSQLKRVSAVIVSEAPRIPSPPSRQRLRLLDVNASTHINPNAIGFDNNNPQSRVLMSIIGMALISQPEEKATLSTMQTWIEENHPKFVSENPKWKCFVRDTKSGQIVFQKDYKPPEENLLTARKPSTNRGKRRNSKRPVQSGEEEHEPDKENAAREKPVHELTKSSGRKVLGSKTGNVVIWDSASGGMPPVTCSTPTAAKSRSTKRSASREVSLGDRKRAKPGPKADAGNRQDDNVLNSLILNGVIMLGRLPQSYSSVPVPTSGSFTGGESSNGVETSAQTNIVPEISISDLLKAAKGLITAVPDQNCASKKRR